MTPYVISLIISAAIFSVAGIFTVIAFMKSYKEIFQTFSPVRILVIGCFLSAAALFVPVYLLGDGSVGHRFFPWFSSVFRSLYDSIRLFIIEGEYRTLYDIMGDSTGVPMPVVLIYNIYSALLFLMAPLLTAGFLLSFFKNISAKIRLFFHFRRLDVHILSGVNDRSVTLAEDIINGKREERAERDEKIKDAKQEYKQAKAELKTLQKMKDTSEADLAAAKKRAEQARIAMEWLKSLKKKEAKKRKGKRPIVIFTDVYEGDDEESSELLERVRAISAVCFQNDITKIPIRKPWAYSKKMSEMREQFSELSDSLTDHVNKTLLADKKAEKAFVSGIEADVKNEEHKLSGSEEQRSEKIEGLKVLRQKEESLFEKYTAIVAGLFEREVAFTDKECGVFLKWLNSIPYHVIQTIESGNALFDSICADIKKMKSLSDDKFAKADKQAFLTLVAEKYRAAFAERMTGVDRCIEILSADTSLSEEDRNLFAQWLEAVQLRIKEEKALRLAILDKVELLSAKACATLRKLAELMIPSENRKKTAFKKISLSDLLYLTKADGSAFPKKDDVNISVLTDKKVCKLLESIESEKQIVYQMLFEISSIFAELDAQGILCAERDILLGKILLDKIDITVCHPKLEALLEEQDYQNHTKLYFMSEDEDENLEQALTLISWCRDEKRRKHYDAPNMQFYVFARTVESTVLLNAADKGNIKVRRVQEDENLAWQILQDYSIFEDALVRDVVLKADHDNPVGYLRSLIETDAQKNEHGANITKYTDAVDVLELMMKDGEATKKERIKNKLLDCSALYVDKPTELNVVVVGFGEHGTEIMKVISWAGQMAGFDIHVHVFDKQTRMAEKVRAFAPGLVESIEYVSEKRFDNGAGDAKSNIVVQRVELNANFEKKGEPHLLLTFYNGTDVDDYEFQERIQGIDNISSVFVTLGNDEQNIKTAFLIRRLACRKLGTLKGYFTPEIYAAVYSPAKNQLIKEHGVLKTAGNRVKLYDFGGDLVSDEEYSITFFSSMKERFSLKVLEAKELEDGAAVCHAAWSENAVSDGIKFIEAESQLNQYEYHRRSSIATALYNKMIDRLDLEHRLDYTSRINPGDTKAEVWSDIMAENEHRRWSVYMRMEGYIYRENEKSELAKTHKLLIPYSNLDKKDRAKNKR